MKRILFLLCFACCNIVATKAQQWPVPRPEAKPGTRWWWLGSAVDEENLRWNLSEYARVGIGAVEITPLYGVQGNDSKNIPFLSPKWMQALKRVEDIARSLGIEVDMNCGTGWPFGGPHVPLKQAACKAIFKDSLVNGSPVYTVEIGRTKQKVKRAAPGGEGFVVDHFDREAVRHYLDHFEQAFATSGVPYPHTFFNDSYEVYKANWTPTLIDEFQKRRGYDLRQHLPELLGVVDDGNQVLCDYRETLSDLLLENFTQQWVAWAHQHGVKVRNQAHGSPANLLDLYAAVDIPEIEGFGLSDFGIKGLRTDPGKTRKNFSDVSMLKYAPSAAHVTGKPLTSSETFTWLTEHFRTSLSQMKPDLDLMFTCGVNHVYFHGSCYTPKDDPWPGWKFYASIDMSPTNSIWRDAPWLMQYIERCQSFLQLGQPDNDFLVYLPVRDMWHQRGPRNDDDKKASKDRRGGEDLLMQFDIHTMDEKAPQFIRSILTIDSLGYDCDYISDCQLAKVYVENGMLVTEGGTRYRALIIPSGTTIDARLQALLDPIAAYVIKGERPEMMARFAKAEPMKAELGLRAIRRKTAKGWHYFIVNLTPRDIEGDVALAVPFEGVTWFNPMNGDICPASVRNGKIVDHGRQPPLPAGLYARLPGKLHDVFCVAFGDAGKEQEFHDGRLLVCLDGEAPVPDPSCEIADKEDPFLDRGEDVHSRKVQGEAPEHFPKQGGRDARQLLKMRLICKLVIPEADHAALYAGEGRPHIIRKLPFQDPVIGHFFKYPQEFFLFYVLIAFGLFVKYRFLCLDHP